MTTVTKKFLKEMKREALEDLLQKSGIEYSSEINKKQLETLAFEQKDQIEDYLIANVGEENKIEEVEEMTNKEKMVEIEINGNVTEVNEEVAERIVEIQENAQDIIAEVVGEEKAAEIVGEKPKKRGGRGKKIIVTKNDEYFDTFVTIKGCAEFFKSHLSLKALPFNQIMKSTRSKGQEIWEVEGDKYKFVFENDEDILTPRQKQSSKKPEEIVEKSQSSTIDYEEVNDEEQIKFLEEIAKSE